MNMPLAHVCICVENMEKSIAFYKEAFDLEPIKRLSPPGFKLVWLSKPINGDEIPAVVELRTDDGHTGSYEKGYCNNHFALIVDDVNAYRARHEKMGIIDSCVPGGPHFVHDIDGYSIEVMDESVIKGLLAE